MTRILLMNLTKRFAVLDDDTVVPITNFFDADGEECDEPDCAVSLVCGDGDRWLGVDLADFQQASPQ